MTERVAADQRAPAEHTRDAFQSIVDRFAGPGHFDWWAARLRGLFEGLGAEVQVRVLVAGQNSRESGRIAGAYALDRTEPPSAIIAISDVMALGVLDAMTDRGLVPGRDISVAGFDDLPEAARAGLTTIRQPIVEKGRLAAELLVDPQRTPRRILLPHELVVRTSTGPV